MKAAKVYKVAITKNNRTTVVTGTLKELITMYFSHTLMCGHDWDDSIDVFPRTIKSLIVNLTASAWEIEHFNPTTYKEIK